MPVDLKLLVDQAPSQIFDEFLAVLSGIPCNA